MTCPGPAFRSSLYAMLIRDCLRPLPERAGATKSPCRARDGGGAQLRDPNEAAPLELNARRNV